MGFKRFKNDNSFDDFCLQALKLKRDETCKYNNYTIERIDWSVYDFKYNNESVIKVVSISELLNAIRLHLQLIKVEGLIFEQEQETWRRKPLRELGMLVVSRDMTIREIANKTGFSKTNVHFNLMKLRDIDYDCFLQ